MALQVAELAIGIAGIATSFKGAINAAQLLESCFDPNKSDHTFLVMMYRMELVRLEQWGSFCGVRNPPDAGQSSRLSDKPEAVKEAITEILGRIEALKMDATTRAKDLNIPLSVTTHDKGTERDPDKKPRSLSAIGQFSKVSMRLRSRFDWVFKGEADFKTIVSRLRELITLLETFVPECKLPSNAFIAQALAKVNDTDQLQRLSDSGDSGNSGPKIDQALVLSARAKLMQEEVLQLSNVSHVASNRLSFPKDGLSFALLSTEQDPLWVWVEWNIVQAGPGSNNYIQRIESLACLLEKVSGPALSLPPCFGVYEDISYEQKYGNKRIGYIFGVPQPDSTSLYQGRGREYNRNLQEYPPKTLGQLMRDGKKTSIPALGERFQLAFALATAFNCFHAAGWLHKGLNSEAITFFHQSGSQDGGISIDEPFITGFQYSRPQDERSLSQGPLENNKFNQYYHPDADKGFTKRRDLYGLGVVLCEIGQWMTMEDRVSGSRNRKKAFDSRADWHTLMIDSVSIDMRWRMGNLYQSVVRTLLLGDLPEDGESDELFAQQYLDKVIRPLSKCCA